MRRKTTAESRLDRVGSSWPTRNPSLLAPVPGTRPQVRPRRSKCVALFNVDRLTRPKFGCRWIVRWENGLVMQLFQNERGATAIEYGLIAALIAVAAIAAFTLVGTN